MTAPALTFEYYSGIAAATPLRDEWDALVRREHLGPDHLFAWLRALSEGNGITHPAVLALRDHGRLVGGTMTYTRIEPRCGVSARVLTPVNFLFCVLGTQLLTSADASAMDALISRLLRNHDWDLWLMVFPVSDSNALAFNRILRARGVAFSIRATTRAPYLSLGTSWDRLLSSLPRKFRWMLRAREARLRAQGRVDVQFISGSEECRRGLDIIKDIEQESWKVRSGSPITGARQWGFYTGLAPTDPSVRFALLYLNGEPIAYDYAVYHDGVYYLLKTSYRDHWRDLYPGFVLRKLVIESLCAEGASAIHFGSGEEEWKLKWTASVQEQVLYTIYGNTVRGRYLWAMHLAGQATRRAQSFLARVAARPTPADGKAAITDE